MLFYKNWLQATCPGCCTYTSDRFLSLHRHQSQSLRFAWGREPSGEQTQSKSAGDTPRRFVAKEQAMETCFYGEACSCYCFSNGLLLRMGKDVWERMNGKGCMCVVPPQVVMLEHRLGTLWLWSLLQGDCRSGCKRLLRDSTYSHLVQ